MIFYGNRQNFTNLFFHRVPVLCCANAKLCFHFLVDFPNGDCTHAINASIASIDCTSSFLFRPGYGVHFGGDFVEEGHAVVALFVEVEVGAVFDVGEVGVAVQTFQDGF